MYEVQVWFNGRLVDGGWFATLLEAREQVKEFMLAHNWGRIELIYPADKAPA